MKGMYFATRTSCLTACHQRRTHLGQHFIARDGLHLSATHLIAATLGLNDPKLVDVAVSGGVEAFHKAIGKSRPRFARQGESCFGQLLDGHTVEGPSKGGETH